MTSLISVELSNGKSLIIDVDLKTFLESIQKHIDGIVEIKDTRNNSYFLNKNHIVEFHVTAPIDKIIEEQSNEDDIDFSTDQDE